MPIAILEISTGSNVRERNYQQMYLHNKYTTIYYRIIKRAIDRNHIKQPNDGYQTHHIIPRCIGGTNNSDNLAVLTFKEHRVCHCLLIKMQTNKTAEIKMRHAYGFFNKSSRYNGPRYKTGKDNIFSTPKIIKQVVKRMTESNPMFRPEQRLRMSFKNNNPYCKAIEVDNICFPSLGQAAKYFNTSPHLFRKTYTYRYCE